MIFQAAKRSTDKEFDFSKALNILKQHAQNASVSFGNSRTRLGLFFLPKFRLPSSFQYDSHLRKLTTACQSSKVYELEKLLIRLF